MMGFRRDFHFGLPGCLNPRLKWPPTGLYLTRMETCGYSLLAGPVNGSPRDKIWRVSSLAPHLEDSNLAISAWLSRLFGTIAVLHLQGQATCSNVMTILISLPCAILSTMLFPSALLLPCATNTVAQGYWERAVAAALLQLGPPFPLAFPRATSALRKGTPCGTKQQQECGTTFLKECGDSVNRLRMFEHG